MFLIIFAVSVEDVIVPTVATMPRRGRCIVEFPLLVFSCYSEEHLESARHLGLVVERMVTKDRAFDDGVIELF